MWTSQNLTRDHKPTERDEAERIKRSNGRVEPSKDRNGNFIGPQRVWLKNDNIPGLGMTRSFGDRIGVECGIIAKPEIMEWALAIEDKFIIIASDGVWEVMDSEEVFPFILVYQHRQGFLHPE